MQRAITSRDFTEEIAYSIDNPNNEERLIYQLALNSFLIYLANRDSNKELKPLAYEDFVMKFDHKKKRSQSEHEMIAFAQRIAASYGDDSKLSGEA